MARIRDGMGREIISGGQVNRIVSLAPSHTEILFYLGLAALVVGVTEHCDYPPEAAQREKTGTFGEPDWGRVKELKPDLVWLEGPMHSRGIDDLERKGIAVYASNPGTVEDVLRSMEDINLLCGGDKKRLSLINGLRARVSRLGEKCPPVRPRVFRLMHDDPVVTPGPGSYQYDALKLAGAELMDFDGDRLYPRVSLDKIMSFDPQIILFCGRKEGEPPKPRCKGCLAERPMCQKSMGEILTGSWSGISAVKNNRIYSLTCDIICRPGPRLMEGMEKLNAYFQS